MEDPTGELFGDRFLTWRYLLQVVCALVLIVAAPPAAIRAQVDPAAYAFPETTWEIRTPSSVGLDDDALESLATQIGGNGLIIKDGYLVYSWGDIETKHDWMSAAKPVTSTLLQFALAQGLLASEHERVGPYVELEFGQPLASKDSAMTFFHLANMTSGYALPSDPGPGTRWGYNDYAFSLYSRLLANQVFGSSLNEAALHPDRLGALQFEDGSIYSSRNGLGLFTSVRDFARIGWLWLNRGLWNGVRLLPEESIARLLSVGVAEGLPTSTGGLDDYLNVGTYGGGTSQTLRGPGVYGFNFWINADGALWPDAPHDTFQANGGWNAHVMTAIPSLKMLAVWSFAEAESPNDFPDPMNGLLKLLTDAATVPFSVSAGWQTISVPVKLHDMSVTHVLDDPSAVAFAFREGRFVKVDSLAPGEGYMVHSRGVSTTFSGEHMLPVGMPVRRGWNLLGVLHRPTGVSAIRSDPPGLIERLVVGESEVSTSSPLVLTPGAAFWVRVGADGHLSYATESE